jgi:uncharacterized protein (TIGR03437 family)
MTSTPLVLGSVVTVAPDGTQTIQPTTEPTLPNGFTNSNPVHLGGAAQAYLIAFGSGFRTASSATALVGSVFFPTAPAKALFMGPAPGFIGLDQINIQLPPLTLEGTAVFDVTLYLGVDGIPVNSGTFTITN